MQSERSNGERGSNVFDSRRCHYWLFAVNFHVPVTCSSIPIFDASSVYPNVIMAPAPPEPAVSSHRLSQVPE
jgi:hypothetical protein